MAYYTSTRQNSTGVVQEYNSTPTNSMNEYKNLLFQNVDSDPNSSNLQTSVVDGEMSQSECYDNNTFEVYPSNSQQTNCVTPENCNQVIQFRFKEIQVSDPLFEKQINGNYSTKLANTGRKRERAPLNARCPKRRRSFQSSDSSLMQLLRESDSDTLSQAISVSGIKSDGTVNKSKMALPPTYTMFTVPSVSIFCVSVILL